MPTWDPDRYVVFDDARTRPARDLLAGVPAEDPRSVVDVGCGPGNSTALLVERWPAAGVIGLDSSEAMLERARVAVPAATFVRDDLRRWRPPAPIDLVFSNATLQWVEDHPAVLAHLLSWLASGGTLAVQMPVNFDHPSHVEMRRLASSPRWREQVGRVLRPEPVAPAVDYQRMLSGPGRRVDVWTTEYLHVLTGEDPVVEWVRGTGLRPVLDALDERDAGAFLDAYTEAMRHAYPPERDGTTLFPFRRLFLVCRLA